MQNTSKKKSSSSKQLQGQTNMHLPWGYNASLTLRTRRSASVGTRAEGGHPDRRSAQDCRSDEFTGRKGASV